MVAAQSSVSAQSSVAACTGRLYPQANFSVNQQSNLEPEPESKWELSIPLTSTLGLPRNIKQWYKFKKLAVEVFEFVPLLDEKVQETFLEDFSGGSK